MPEFDTETKQPQVSQENSAPSLEESMADLRGSVDELDQKRVHLGHDPVMPQAPKKSGSLVERELLSHQIRGAGKETRKVDEALGMGRRIKPPARRKF